MKKTQPRARSARIANVLTTVAATFLLAACAYQQAQKAATEPVSATVQMPEQEHDSRQQAALGVLQGTPPEAVQETVQETAQGALAGGEHARDYAAKKEDKTQAARADKAVMDALSARRNGAPASLTKQRVLNAAPLLYEQAAMPVAAMPAFMAQAESREKYQQIANNPVKLTAHDSVSTLSLDVDTGSYSNVRRFLNQGQLPPADAVRVEELVNYFPYDYPSTVAGHPFAVSTELAAAPWNPAHYLLRVGVKTVEKSVAAMPPANLVFLVDVSGSMDSPDKLPLVQATLKLLTEQLRAQDRVALVVYAGRTAVELPPTSGDQKARILAAIARLQAGGATAGEAAIKLAYAQARAGFIKGGINRILLATDGDFNVGISDIEQIKDLVKRERESGISLTTLGFGQGNYQEALMEQIADVGNGNYSYIDTLSEARKVLVEELSSTFNTVAKDVKIQLEFNADQVAEWRLIGYENRVLREEDFRNDQVDAGDVGAGKSVTALYEITPAGAATLHASRRYKNAEAAADPQKRSRELGFLRIRYKQPDARQSVEVSRAISTPVAAAEPSADFRFASAVAGFGQLLRQSPYTGTFTYADAKRLAETAIAQSSPRTERERTGQKYRRELITLIDLARTLSPSQPVAFSAHDQPPAD